MAGVQRARRRLASVVLVAVGMVVSMAADGAPAWAHAAGQLPTAELSSQGSTVRIDLVLSADDAAAIGEGLGYLDDGAMLALLGSGPDDALPTDDQIAALSASSQLRDYLESHVVVLQDGQACPGEASPGADFLLDGASLTFRCPAPVGHAEVRITILHDQDRAYRTFSVDGTEQYAIHTAAAPTHPWDFTAGAADSGGDPILLGAAGVAGGLLVLGVVVAVPRRRRAGGA